LEGVLCAVEVWAGAECRQSGRKRYISVWPEEGMFCHDNGTYVGSLVNFIFFAAMAGRRIHHKVGMRSWSRMPVQPLWILPVRLMNTGSKLPPNLSMLQQKIYLVEFDRIKEDMFLADKF
jgi:hypothetical protein